MRPEILAPGGGMETLIAAVKSGADAVYIGSDKFSARSSAVNFNDEQMAEAVDFCHKNMVKLYLTINTLIADRELEDVKDLIMFANEIGVDSLIVQDLAVAKIAREVAPQLHLHASTQMTIKDLDGVKVAEKLGFKRVVLARELSMEEIEYICNNTNVEIEVFVHGAICVSYSGQCLMSSFIGGRSSNRGRCAQPCRLQYCDGDKTGTLISPKDMCLINHLKTLEKIGVKSLKIEGRMKGVDYICAVVGIYRKYLDSGETITDSDYKILEGVFYRGGLTDGYFTGNINNMICDNKPGNPYGNQKEKFVNTYKKQIPINIEVDIKIGKPLYMRLNDVEYNGEILAETAVNKPLSQERVIAQVTKLGDSIYCCEKPDVKLESGAIIPISEINKARRYCVDILEQRLVNALKNRDSYDMEIPRDDREPGNFHIVVEVANKEQELAFDEMGVAVCYERDYVNNIGEIGRSNNGNYQLNVFNNIAMSEYEDLGICVQTLSSELTLKQIAEIGGVIEVIGYGYMPLMTMKGHLSDTVLTDRKDVEFKVINNQIFNSKPIYMGDKQQDLIDVGVNFVRLKFTFESPKECVKIYQMFKAELPADFGFTRGKFYKGV